MGAYAGPDVSENGLVLALDAANQKSLNIPSQSDHGYADWYCFVSGTVTYSIINTTGGIIYERNGSTVTAVVTTSGPQRGTFSATAGRFYYGSVPINIVVEDQHHYIVPLTMVGTQFWNVVVRNNPSTYYVYSPYQAATVNFYDNTAGGLTGTPTSTLSLSAGQSGTFTSNNLTNHWISSNVPIIASTTQDGWDRTILSPMSTYVYQRYGAYNNTTNFTTPTNLNSYVTYDSTYKVMNMTIADGAGGDCAQGLGLEYLSDTYSWGNVLSDYTIVFPYNGTFTASYWNGSAWVVWDTHTITTGSITNPPRVTRDGTNGAGVEASALSGLATNMASGATLWKWEGTAPFYLAINDNADDEFSVLGWNSSTQNTPRSGNTITDISGNGNNGTLLNGPVYVKDNLGVLSFDGTNDFIDLTNKSVAVSGNGARSIFCWVKSTTGGRCIVSTGTANNSQAFNLVTYGSSKVGVMGYNYDFYPTTGANIFDGNWHFVGATYNGAGTLITYVDGIQDNISTGRTYSTTGQNNFIGKSNHVGSEFYWNGNIAQVSIYNRALTAQEIQQNYNATKSRFGL